MDIRREESEDVLDDEEYLDELPASYRVKDDLIATAHPDLDLIEQEFDLKKLHIIMKYLWMAGRPVPPRPLHHQLLLRREVVITERMDMHLVWGQGRIFLKPIPRFLLNQRFWDRHLTCSKGLFCKRSTEPCVHCRLRDCSTGFLVSYTALIAHESDYYIALEKRLLPMNTSWRQWRIFVRGLLAERDEVPSRAADRFIYGELRLNRLNLIYLFLGHSFIGYLPRWNSYGSFYRDNTELVIGSTAYCVIILSAMQVGLTTTRLADNAAFQAASYGMTVFSIVAPLGGVALIFIVFLIGFVVNWAWARQGLHEREKVLGRNIDGSTNGSIDI